MPEGAYYAYNYASIIRKCLVLIYTVLTSLCRSSSIDSLVPISLSVYVPQALELECLALDPKLQAVQSAYDGWEELGKEGGGVWEGDGEDDARGEKEAAEQQYSALLDRIRDQKGMLDSELSE